MDVKEIIFDKLQSVLFMGKDYEIIQPLETDPILPVEE